MRGKDDETRRKGKKGERQEKQQQKRRTKSKITFLTRERDFKRNALFIFG